MKVLAFPYHDWRKAQADGMRWRDAHLIQHLASHPAVECILVVDRPVSLAEALARRRSPFVAGTRIAARRFGLSIAHLTQVSERITVLDVFVPDVFGPVRDRYEWWYEILASDTLHRALDWARRRLAIARPSVIGWTPTMAGAMSAIGDRGPLVFDALDNWLIHPSLKKYSTPTESAYAQLARAGTVVVAAPASQTVFQRWAANVHVIPNGVDPERFNRSLDRPRDLPPRPIVGYAGSLGQRIDGRLVRETARMAPDVNFVFIGQTLDGSGPQLRGPNLFYLGDRHYDALPAYIGSFDVAWIPHTVGTGESGGDPIKLYEYMAAGRPILSTRIDGHERWREWVYFIDDAEPAAQLVRGLLSGRVRPLSPTLPPERTWSSIAQRIAVLMTDVG